MEKFIHELDDAKDLFEAAAEASGLNVAFVEKDYWIAHCLWGLQKNGFRFEIKEVLDRLEEFSTKN